MKVSIIIPVYNEEKVLESCLSSLLIQNYKDLEIIVVDDGSTDNTVAILERFKNSDPRINFIKQNHKGAGVARNLGCKNAKGEVFVFVDADMSFDRKFISYLVEPILAGTAIGTFSKEEYLLNKTNIWAKAWNLNRGLPLTRMLSENYPNMQKVFRAIVAKEFNKAGGFNEKSGYTDDWTLSEKLGVEAVVAPGAVFFHKNPDNLIEVFIQSRWMGKRKYKNGLLGFLYALLRVSMPISFVVGVYKSIKHKMPQFLVFKFISDFGQFIGILEYYMLGKVSK